MREVYVAASVADAELVCDLLRREGVAAAVGNADAESRPTVCVLEDGDEREARRLLVGWLGGSTA